MWWSEQSPDLVTPVQPTRCNVLIVEDHDDSRNMLARLLRRHGYQTCTAATVAEGVSLLDGQHCAVLDLNLPDGLGTAVIRRIRSEGRSIRVVVLTATSDPQSLAEVGSFQPDHVFLKPLNVDALLAWLRQQPGLGIRARLEGVGDD